MNHKKCNCKFCQRNTQFSKHLALIKEAGLTESVEFIKSLYSHLNCVEMDNNVNEAIINGSWPSANQIIAVKRQKSPMHQIFTLLGDYFTDIKDKTPREGSPVIVLAQGEEHNNLLSCLYLDGKFIQVGHDNGKFHGTCEVCATLWRYELAIALDGNDE